MRYEEWLPGDLQCRLQRRGAGVGHVHKNLEPIALLDRVCAHGRKAAKACAPVDIAQRRDHVIVVMEQLQRPEPTLVDFFDSLDTALDEVRAFYGCTIACCPRS